jgi:ribosomal RNA-processing protein 36
VEERLTWHREEKQRIMEGKKPFWLDRKAMKDMERQRKFKELKESGKLERYLNKKGRKLKSRDKKRGIIAGLG